MQPLIIEEFGKNVTNQDEATIQKERNPVFKNGETACRCHAWHALLCCHVGLLPCMA